MRKVTDACEGNEIGRERFELALEDPLFPKALSIPHPPARSVRRGAAPARWSRDWLSWVARDALRARLRQALLPRLPRERGVAIISGARGAATPWPTRRPFSRGRAHGGLPRGGCNQLYPAENAGLFQHRGGWRRGGLRARMGLPPQPHTFRARNRPLQGLSRATLIVEAAASGTFSTADEALLAGRGGMGGAGAITSAASKGANRLLYQGAPHCGRRSR